MVHIVECSCQIERDKHLVSSGSDGGDVEQLPGVVLDAQQANQRNHGQDVLRTE